jgi:hypothetical protein
MGRLDVKKNTKIVVLQRGWVFVGEWSEDGDMVTLNEASCIRIWGSTKGLGELALTGPTSKTVLDPTGKIHFHILTTVVVLDTDKF